MCVLGMRGVSFKRIGAVLRVVFILFLCAGDFVVLQSRRKLRTFGTRSARGNDAGKTNPKALERYFNFQNCGISKLMVFNARKNLFQKMLVTIEDDVIFIFMHIIWFQSANDGMTIVSRYYSKGLI